MKRALVSLMILTGLTGAALAGVHLVEVEENLLDDSSIKTDIWLQDGHLRVADAAENLVFLFSADQEYFHILDESRQLKARVTMDEMKSMMAEFQDVMSEEFPEELKLELDAYIEEAKAALSPEELAQLESLMNGSESALMPDGVLPGEPAREVWELVGTQVPIEPWSCYHYRSRNGEELQGEVWTAATSALGLEAADTRALTSLVEMMSQMAGNAESLHELGARDAGTDFTGFPVKQVTYVSGQAVSSSTTRIANQGQLDATLFVIPDGYREVPFMELLMGDGLGQ